MELLHSLSVLVDFPFRSVLDQVADHTSQGINTPPPEDEEEEELLPLSQPSSSQDADKKKLDRKRAGFRVATEEISVPELARECVISLSAPQNDPQWLREELRTRGALDHLANMGEWKGSGGKDAGEGKEGGAGLE